MRGDAFSRSIGGIGQTILKAIDRNIDHIFENSRYLAVVEAPGARERWNGRIHAGQAATQPALSYMVEIPGSA